jgi:hypothetical protein
MEYNHVCLWPVVMKNNGDMHFTEGKPLQTPTELEIQKVRKVDPVTFYLLDDIPRIKSGELIGDLTPAINSSICPDSETFWAFLIGSTKFSTSSGTYIGPLYPSHIVSKGIKYRKNNIYKQMNVLQYPSKQNSFLITMVIIYSICFILFVILLLLKKIKKN